MQRRLHVKPFFKTPNALFKIWTHNSRTRLNSTITFCNNTLKLNSRQKLPASKHSYYTLASWLKKRSLKWSQKQKLKHHVWAVGEMLLCTVCVCVCDGGAKLLMDTDNRVPTVFQLLLTTGKNLNRLTESIKAVWIKTDLHYSNFSCLFISARSTETPKHKYQNNTTVYHTWRKTALWPKTGNIWKLRLSHTLCHFVRFLLMCRTLRIRFSFLS